MSASISSTYKPANGAWYAKNTVPKLLIENATETITVTLYFKDQEAQTWDSSDVAFRGSYSPDFNGEIWVDFAGVYDDFISTKMPVIGQTSLVQDKSWYYFRVVVTDSSGNNVGTAITWQVFNAKLNSATPFQTWSQQNFLTNQPMEKPTTYDSREWLTYLDLAGDYNIIGRFYPKEGGNVDCIVRADEAMGCYSVNVSYAELIQHVARLPHQLKGYYDIILCDGKLSEICRQRYIYRERSGKEHYFLFVNALGGVDTLICDGENVLQPETTYNIGRFDKRFIPIDDTDDNRQWSQNTGMVPHRWRNWMHELLTAKQDAAFFNQENSTLNYIVITESEIGMSDNGQLASASFTYMMTEVDNVMADTERALERGVLHASVAEQAEELNDLSSSQTVAFEENGQGDFETDELEILATKLYITDPRAVFAAGETAVYYYLNDDETAAGSFTPGVTAMPFVINKLATDTIRFSTQNEAVETIIINYYPVTVQAE